MMRQLMILTTVTLAASLVAPEGATAQYVRGAEEAGFPQGTSQNIRGVTRGAEELPPAPVVTEDAGFPQPAGDIRFGGYTALERDTSEEGFDK